MAIPRFPQAAVVPAASNHATQPAASSQPPTTYAAPTTPYQPMGADVQEPLPANDVEDTARRDFVSWCSGCAAYGSIF